MSRWTSFKVEGLRDFAAKVELAPRIARQAARETLNQTADFAKAEAARRMQTDVALPPSFVKRNLRVSRRATDRSLEAVISGRSRPTSLARFADKASNGVRISVKRSGRKSMRRGFFIKLRRGQAAVADGFNTGLAIRLKPGEKVKGKKVQAKAFGGDSALRLLYGPSVHQMFRSEREAMAPLLEKRLGQGFTDRFDRLLRAS